MTSRANSTKIPDMKWWEKLGGGTQVTHFTGHGYDAGDLYPYDDRVRDAGAARKRILAGAGKATAEVAGWGIFFTDPIEDQVTAYMYAYKSAKKEDREYIHDRAARAFAEQGIESRDGILHSRGRTFIDAEDNSAFLRGETHLEVLTAIDEEIAKKWRRTYPHIIVTMQKRHPGKVASVRFQDVGPEVVGFYYVAEA